MKVCTTYRVNKPTTTSGYSLTISTTLYGTEEEIEYLKKNCEESIGSGLIQEYGSPLTSQFHLKKNETRWTDKVFLDNFGNIISTDGCPTDKMTQELIDKIKTNIGCAKPIEGGDTDGH